MTRTRGPKLRWWYVYINSTGDTEFECIGDGWKRPSERQWNPSPDEPAALFYGRIVRDSGDATEMIDSNAAWDAWADSLT